MIKFLKKFKDKILIALACSFIGIGTILCNTLETKAYNNGGYFTSSISTLNINNVDIDLENTTSYNYSNSDVIKIIFNESTNFNNYVLLLNVSSINSPVGTYRYWAYNSSYINNFYLNNTSSYVLIINPSNYNFANNSSTTFWCSFFFNFTINNIDFVTKDNIYTLSYSNQIQAQLDSLQSQYDTLLLNYQNYQNTHAYTNEQYNNLMTQNAFLTQQVQALQSQYDTYVSLHSYTNTQYETLLNNYNNLQIMYNNLQQQYLNLQQEYNRLTIDLAPFRSSIWGNRQATLNGVSIDVSSSANLNSVVWFRDSYLQFDQREFENFSSYIEGDNSFQLVTTSDSIITINSYTAIANFSSTNGYGFSIEFYLNNSLVNTTTFFDGSMTTDDGGTTNTFNYNAPITFNKMIIDIVGGPGPSTWNESSYFKANPGTWQMGYDYAVEQLQPRIDVLENSLEQAINQQQAKYAEGYNKGVADRIIKNLYIV